MAAALLAQPQYNIFQTCRNNVATACVDVEGWAPFEWHQPKTEYTYSIDYSPEIVWGAGVNIEDCPCEPMLPVISHSHTHTPTSQLNTAVVSSGSAIQENPRHRAGDFPGWFIALFTSWWHARGPSETFAFWNALMARRITAPVEDQDWRGYANPSLTSNYCKYIIAHRYTDKSYVHTQHVFTHILRLQANATC